MSLITPTEFCGRSVGLILDDCIVPGCYKSYQYECNRVKRLKRVVDSLDHQGQSPPIHQKHLYEMLS